MRRIIGALLILTYLILLRKHGGKTGASASRGERPGKEAGSTGRARQHRPAPVPLDGQDGRPQHTTKQLDEKPQ